MTPLERLLAEELPTGTFGDAPERRASRSPRPAPARPVERPADPDAAAHCAELPNPYAPKAKRQPTTRRHLRAVPPPTLARKDRP